MLRFEMVVLLSKGMIDSRKVKVDFSLEDMDLSECKGAKGLGTFVQRRPKRSEDRKLMS